MMMEERMKVFGSMANAMVMKETVANLYPTDLWQNPCPIDLSLTSQFLEGRFPGADQSLAGIPTLLIINSSSHTHIISRSTRHSKEDTSPNFLGAM
jgi:hypothetical protein